MAERLISHMWVSGGDQFFFCKQGITELADFEGRKVRSHGSALSDWIEGFGANAQFVAFAEVYTALERGILDCGVTVAFAAHAQRWYEVTDFMVGPLSSQLLNTVIVNRDVWDGPAFRHPANNNRGRRPPRAGVNPRHPGVERGLDPAEHRRGPGIPGVLAGADGPHAKRCGHGNTWCPDLSPARTRTTGTTSSPCSMRRSPQSWA